MSMNQIDLTSRDPEPNPDIVVNDMEVTENEKRLKEYLIDHVFSGQPELRTYAFETFMEMCSAEVSDSSNNEKPLHVRIQEQIYGRLTQEEIRELAARLPKGLTVKVESTLFYDGSSPIATRFNRALVGQHGLSEEDHEAELGYRDLSKGEVDNVLSSELSEKPLFIDTVEGVIEAEPIQGYGGIRIRTDKGEIQRIGLQDITAFIITGISSDRSDLQRRPRELYPDRIVWIQDETGQWRKGKITSRFGSISTGFIADLANVELDVPIEEITALDTPRKVNEAKVYIGKPMDYEPTDIPPELGHSEFEMQAWRFENITLDEPNTETTNHIEKVPEQYRSGNLVRFPDGTITRVGHSSTQGRCQLIGLKGAEDVSEVEWIRIDQDKEPQVLRKIEDENYARLVGRRIKFTMGKQGEKEQRLRASIQTQQDSILNALSRYAIKLATQFRQAPEMILRVDGVYNIDGLPNVVIEALPVNIGTRANNPGKRFFTYPITSYERLKELRFVEESQADGYLHLQAKFPSVADEVLSVIRDDGNVNCRFSLKSGETHSYGYANFATLPFGIYTTVGDDREPILIRLEDISFLEVITD